MAHITDNEPMGFTVLTPEDEASFQTWYAQQSKLRGTNPDPDAAGHHFDYRRAYMSGWNPSSPDEHGSSQFKMEGSPERFISVGEQLLDTKTNMMIGSIRKRK